MLSDRRTRASVPITLRLRSECRLQGDGGTVDGVVGMVQRRIAYLIAIFGTPSAETPSPAWKPPPEFSTARGAAAPYLRTSSTPTMGYRVSAQRRADRSSTGMSDPHRPLAAEWLARTAMRIRVHYIAGSARALIRSSAYEIDASAPDPQPLLGDLRRPLLSPSTSPARRYRKLSAMLSDSVTDNSSQYHQPCRFSGSHGVEV